MDVQNVASLGYNSIRDIIPRRLKAFEGTGNAKSATGVVSGLEVFGVIIDGFGFGASAGVWTIEGYWPATVLSVKGIVRAETGDVFIDGLASNVGVISVVQTSGTDTEDVCLKSSCRIKSNMLL